MEQALENVATSRNVGDLKERLEMLAKRITGLKTDLDPYAQRNRLDAAIEALSTRITGYARLLQLEHATENIRLNMP